jgi:SAM-dependent methyltransferase
MALPDHALRARISGLPWTINVRLSENVQTIPTGHPEFLSSDRRLKAILRTLDLVYGPDLGALRIADLGCLEGGFAVALAQRGARVMGVEARAVNIVKGQLLKEHFGLGSLDFVCDDVKNFNRQRYGSFDVILALGILYHIDQPVQWLRQIADAATGLLIVDSHLAPPDDDSLGRIDQSIARLGPLRTVTVDSRPYSGRWFREVEGRPVDVERDLWAAYSNDESFWLTKESLVLALEHAGFDLAFEQYDCMWDQYAIFTEKLVRALFVAAKTNTYQARPWSRRRSVGAIARRLLGWRRAPS